MKPTISTFLFLLTAVLPCPTVQAQTRNLEGTVVDPSGKPIGGAVVRCNDKTVQSGPDGGFRITGMAVCKAEISAPGFEVQHIQLTPETPVRVQLNIAGLNERIVVTATRAETTVEQAGVDASIVTRADLRGRGFLPVSDVLRSLPGLQVTTTGRYGSLTSVFTRGAERTGTLVLVDGVPVNDPGGEFNLAHLTSSDLERIEVVRGPESPIFGAEAAAGVIQLFTQQGDPESVWPHGSFSYERGSFGTDRWTAGLSGGSGSLIDYSLHAEQFHTVGEFQNDAYRNTVGSANLGLHLSPNTRLRGVVRAGDSIVGAPGQVAYGLYDFDAAETNRDTVVSLRLDDVRGSRYFQQIAFGYHRIRDLYTDWNIEGPYPLAALVRDVSTPVPRTYLVSLLDPNNLPSVIPSGTRLVEQQVTLYPLSEPYLSATSRKHFSYLGTLDQRDGSIVFGYDYERQQGDVSQRIVARGNHGAFLHVQRALARRVFFAGGARLEHSSAFGGKFVPRGAVNFLLVGEHGPVSRLFLRFGAGRGITEPSLIQNFSREAYFVGNPKLLPEKTTTYEAGIAGEWFGRRAATDVTVFNNSFTDLITFVSLPPPLWGSWENVDKSRARGMESSGRVRLARQIELSGSFMRLWTRIIRSSTPASPFTGIGQELGRRPARSGAVSMSFAPRRCWFQMGAVFVGERQDYDYNLGVTRNPGYRNVYAMASFKLREHISPFLRTDNLLNMRYEEVLGYSSQSRSVRGGVRVAW